MRGSDTRMMGESYKYPRWIGFFQFIFILECSLFCDFKQKCSLKKCCNFTSSLTISCLERQTHQKLVNGIVPNGETVYYTSLVDSISQTEQCVQQGSQHMNGILSLSDKSSILSIKKYIK